MEAAIVTAFVADAVQPCPSVMDTVYVPAASPVASGVNCTGVVFHEKVYGAEPPVTETLAVPVFELHRVVVVVTVPVNLAGEGATNAEVVEEHPLESNTEYV